MFNPLYLLVAPSGAGKTTLVEDLMAMGPGIQQLVSTATRKPREGEYEGHPYYFVSEERWRTMCFDAALIQTVEFAGKRYGTTRQEALTKLAQTPCVCIVETQGPANFRKALASPVYTVFLKPASPEVAIERMRLRKTPEEEIARRRFADRVLWEYESQADFVLPSTTREETATAFRTLIERTCGRKAA